MTKQIPESKPEPDRLHAGLQVLRDRYGYLFISLSAVLWAITLHFDSEPEKTALLLFGAASLTVGLIKQQELTVSKLIKCWEKKLGQNLDRMVRHYSLSEDRGPDLFGPKIDCSCVEIIVEIVKSSNRETFGYSIQYILFLSKVLTEPVRFQVLVAPFPVRLGSARSELCLFPLRSSLAPEDMLTLCWSPIHTGQWSKEAITEFAESVRSKTDIFDWVAPETEEQCCEEVTEATEQVTYGWREEGEKYKRRFLDMPTKEGKLRCGSKAAVFNVGVRDHPRDGPRLVVAPPTRCTELVVRVGYPQGFEVDLVPYIADWLVSDRTDVGVVVNPKDKTSVLSLLLRCKEGKVFAPADAFHIVVRPGPASVADQVAQANPNDGDPPHNVGQTATGR